jgi:hypothetical protein
VAEGFGGVQEDEEEVSSISVTSMYDEWSMENKKGEMHICEENRQRRFDVAIPVL